MDVWIIEKAIALTVAAMPKLHKKEVLAFFMDALKVLQKENQKIKTS